MLKDKENFTIIELINSHSSPFFLETKLFQKRELYRLYS